MIYIWVGIFTETMAKVSKYTMALLLERAAPAATFKNKSRELYNPRDLFM